MPAAGLSTQTGWTLYSVSAKSRCLKIQEVGSQFLKSRHRQGANSNKFWIKGENFKERRWWPHLSARVASKDGLCFKIMEGTSSALLVLRWAFVCLSSSPCWHYRCVPPCPAQLQSLIAFYRWGNQVLKVYILLIEDEISPKWLSRSISQTARAFKLQCFIASLGWHDSSHLQLSWMILVCDSPISVHTMRVYRCQVHSEDTFSATAQESEMLFDTGSEPHRSFPASQR